MTLEYVLEAVCPTLFDITLNPVSKLFQLEDGGGPSFDLVNESRIGVSGKVAALEHPEVS